MSRHTGKTDGGAEQKKKGDCIGQDLLHDSKDTNKV